MGSLDADAVVALVPIVAVALHVVMCLALALLIPEGHSDRSETDEG